jgi:hypothetical protein
MKKKLKKTRIFIILFVLSVFICISNSQRLFMFSNNLLSEYANIPSNSSYFFDSLLANQTLVNRIESNKYCSPQLMSSFISLIVANSNNPFNSFESWSKAPTCEELVDFFCNPAFLNRLLLSHSVYDCEDYLQTNSNNEYIRVTDQNSANGMQLITLSATSAQIEAALASFMNQYGLRRYSIVFSDTTNSSIQLQNIISYQNLAASLVYKFSLSFTLDYSLSITDTSLEFSLSNLRTQGLIF